MNHTFFSVYCLWYPGYQRFFSRSDGNTSLRLEGLLHEGRGRRKKLWYRAVPFTGLVELESITGISHWHVNLRIKSIPVKRVSHFTVEDDNLSVGPRIRKNCYKRIEKFADCWSSCKFKIILQKQSCPLKRRSYKRWKYAFKTLLAWWRNKKGAWLAVAHIVYSNAESRN